MLSSFNDTYRLYLYFQDENIVRYALTPPKQRAELEAYTDGGHAGKSRFFQGILIALPFSVFFWALIFWAIKDLVF